MEAPEIIGRYHVERLLGHGGMAVVFLARDPRMDRHVAVKLLPRQFTFNDDLRQRFYREARIIAALEHPAIVPTYDFGEHEGQPYLVMRYMAGGSLGERLEQPLSLERTVAIFTRLAPALDKAHERGIIHRDLKPDNVLFDEDDFPYLADFGVARLAEGTKTMSIVGTPAFMSPEQIQGDRELDSRCDVYALGAMLFLMLTGERPYEADTPPKLMFKHVHEPVPDLLALRPDLPNEIQAVIERAMAKSPDERYATAKALTEAVSELATATSPHEIAAANHRSREVDSSAKTVVDGLPLAPCGTGTASEEAESIPSQNEKVDEESRTEAPAASGASGAWWQRSSPWGLGALALMLLVLIWGGGRLFTRNGPTPTSQSPQSTSMAGRSSTRPFVTATDDSMGAPAVTLEPTPTAMPSPTVTATHTRAPTSSPAPTSMPTVTLDPNVLPSSGQLGDTWTRPVDGMEMVYVPAGRFFMGSTRGDPAANSEESPQHAIVLDAFWLDRTEVSNAQYDLCVGDGACPLSEFAGDQAFNGAAYPVVGVSWNNARDYCAWTGAGLPTEAQWEYAARGPNSPIYPWGDEAPTCELAQFSECNGRATVVGTHLQGASWVGALNMAGNVWEWVKDWYQADYYGASPVENPRGPNSGTSRVLRGGSWYSNRYLIRAAYRYGENPTVALHYIGFRCASVSEG
ncbi:MAG: SUMF1/EgtB/PvdO family nonheme iron enzyme [Candidatus Promineifilaceae bacterium]|nr:SUMF1/EgtB/PvdO family nonheme iron enzyme [Candidatus Promineifilaceae bacterium]